MSVLRKTRKQKVSWPRRILLGVLSAGLLSSLPMASLAAEETKVAYPATEKPIVTVQGNAVIDEAGKPTGFYELALCVQTADIIRSNVTHELITREEYDELVKKDPSQAANYTITPDVGHSFRSVAATLTVNTDVLTPVNWDVEYPEYDKWLGTAYENFDTYDVKGIRGIDPAKSDQNTLWWNEVPDITNAVLGDGFFAVGLDTAKPDEINVATARVEGYDAAGRKAVITMAGGTQLGGLTYSKPTPVVVIRFAYDLKRFPNVLLSKGNEVFSVARIETEGKAGTTVLTYLSDDDQASESTNNQSVWYEAYTKPGNEFTAFYYYLDGELEGFDGTQTVNIEGETSPVTVKLPRTAGKAVLAKDESQTEKYSYFHNLLKVESKTLNFNYVNQLTYRKPAGSTGVMVLYYDWDDKLIGTQVVSPKGDVRAQVNEYVEKNFIHPDLRTGSYIDAAGGDVALLLGNSDYVNLVDSLARDETYRGKYAYTVGEDTNTAKMFGPDSAQPGSEYPLTNKLDYVFYRRVNRISEQTYTLNGKTVTDRYVTVSSVADAANGDAALYPYVNGWAVVEDTSDRNRLAWQVRRDALKTEDTWTTFGVGELAEQKPGYNAAASGAQAIPGAADAPAGATGFDERLVEPAFLAELREDDPSLPTPVNYEYKTSTNGDNGYLRFADFSDIGAEMAKYQTEDGKMKDTLIVKAVYEPGEALRFGSAYQIAEPPTYNKLNEKSAAMGGAYSVQITLERANASLGKVQGVSRVRDPAIRQDTTIDQKWISDVALGVDHDLSNPSTATAQGLTETTFTNVDVDNGDMVVFTLSLSARQNKINYFLTEKYGYNFVSGGQRSDSNFLQTGEAFAIDNYNYFADGDSDTKDTYFDVTNYEDRDGSHGFVLYGTLNSMLLKASQWNQGNLSAEDRSNYLSTENMNDANLRADSVGTKIDIFNFSAVQDKILDAAEECERDHYGDPDFWNNDLDCAELNYHQLQHYIVGRGLMDRDTADALAIDWCHLHAKCAEAMSNKPKNWLEIMEAASQRDADRLKQLSLDELKTMTHLRATASGGDFTNRDVMVARLITAVNGDASLTDWVDVQKALLSGSGSVDTYWWYDGVASNPAPGNWAALLERTVPAVTAQTYPDGATRTTKAKLESVRSLFNANAAAGDNKATRQWISLTDNLVIRHREEQVEVEVNGETMQEWHYTYSPPTDFEDFIAKLIETVAAAQPMGMTDPGWEAVQYHLLFPDETLDFINEPWTAEKITLLDTSAWDPDADPPPMQWPEGYWWKGGNVPLTVDSTYTLLEAMKLLNGDDEDEQKRAKEALSKVDLARLEGQGFWLRKSKTGEPWLERDEDGTVTGPDAATQETLLKALLADIQAAQKAGAYNWNTLQYYLVHKDDDPKPDLTDRLKVNGEAYYYWWSKGGTGTRVDFSTVATVEDIFLPLFRASIRAGEFGDPAAADSVEEQLADGSFYKLTHLTQTWAGTEETLADLSWFTTTEGLLQKMNDLMKFLQNQQSITDPYTLPEVNWYIAQYWLLNNSYLIYGTDDYNKAVEDYWWYDKDKKPEEVPPPAEEPHMEVLAIIEANMGQTVTVTADQMDATGFVVHKLQTGKSANNTVAGKMLTLLAKEATLSNYVVDGKLKLTWVQVQYYLATAHAANAKGTKPGTLTDHATALAGLKGMGWDPSKFPKGVITE